jgi:hypothetical protein
MFTDNDRPSGLYGEVYDRQTNARDRFVGMPYRKFEYWEAEIARIALEEINKKLNLHGKETIERS